MDITKLTIGNGAGSVKTIEQVKEACKGPATRITVGSITALGRVGNIGETYYYDPRTRNSFNAIGLLNAGIKTYRTWLPEMVKIANDAGKELWANISPSSPQEGAEMADVCYLCNVDGVEYNGSCPNVWDGGKRKSIPALDPAAADAQLFALRRYVGATMDLAYKMSPTLERLVLDSLAEVFRRHEVTQLVCCNTLPDQWGKRENGEPALSFRTSEQDPVKKHTGGMGGSGVNEINAQVAHIMRELMPEDTLIIGVGGIFDGAGAKPFAPGVVCQGLQSTTGYLEYGNRVLVDILQDLAKDEA